MPPPHGRCARWPPAWNPRPPLRTEAGACGGISTRPLASACSKRRAADRRNHGRITAIDPPYLFSYTWSEDHDAPSEVSFELSAQGAQVRLVVTHRRLAGRDEIISVCGGWHTHLGILIARLSGQTPDGFWRTHTRLEAEYEQRIA
ncbi:SRPBCC domain-containing protein [Lysobacter sp. CA199]|uniref:SRPBCC domain-containing protein n=1 Tax=Lysobacter sp. CA199 TaxID=3455608 RepID=UPI003F8D884C